MSDLEAIKQIERRIGTSLMVSTVYSLMESTSNGYALNEQQQLIGLNLDECRLDDISLLSQFDQLKGLSLSKNQITELTPLKALKKLNVLYLNNNQISNLSGLSNLNSLTTLVLDNNKIIELVELQELENLTKLSLSGNHVTEVTALQNLKNLNKLYLSDNKICELPVWILELNLNIRWNYKRANGIFLKGNPLKSPPLEIIKQGNISIKAYFDSLKEPQRPLNELKVLLVGDGCAGKTSLSKVLRGDTFNPQESQTHGINIDHWQHQDLILHFWDFGGQETMHATHQFFLSKRSLYILVLDGRKEEDAEYWLKHIESFGGDSPVLIVLNKIDEHPSFDVNRKHLLDKYQGIIGFYKLSCDTQQGLDEFKQAFIKAFDTVEMLQTVWGESWLNVKQALEGWQQHTISAGEYRKLCHDQRVTDSQTQDILAQFLNDLGVVVYFADLDLNDTHVLKPRWITEAVYKIINAKQLAIKKGVLCLQELAEILKPVTDEDYHYPPEKHRHIIELMKKFELCYELDKYHILIPDLLDVQEPEFSFADKQPLRFRLEYDFLPKSIMPRFIVKRHANIKDSLRWRTGVVLYDKNTDATAIIRADDRERLIDIQVGGKQKRDYFAVIRGTLNDIHASFQKLTITELVPLPDNPTICLEYQELIGYELDGEDNYRVGKLRKVYSVSELLNGIEKPEKRQHGNIYVNGDYVQEKKVAEINQHSNGNTRLTSELEELYQVLKEVDGGKKSFKPNGEGIEALKKFQSTICCLREAESRGYISNVICKVSKDGDSHGKILTALVTKGLTFKAYEVLRNPEKLIIDNHPQASIDMSTQNVNITGSTINNNGIFNLGEINGNVSQTIQQLPAEQNDLKALLSQLQTLINTSPLTEAVKQKALTKTQDIAEVTKQPEEEQKSIVQKTLGYFDGLADSLESGTETAIKLGETVAGIAHLFGL